MKDYHTPTGANWEKLTDEQKAKVKASAALSLKKVLEAELTEAEKQREVELLKEIGGPRARLANQDFAEHLDQMMVAGLGRGIASFFPKRKLGPLGLGDKRGFVEQSDPLTGEIFYRSVLTLASGERLYELPRVIADSKVISPALHLAVDQGSVGWPTYLWLLLGKGCRMTLCNDILHRLHNDWLDAVAGSGLMVIRFEFRHVGHLRRGRWGGPANASILQAAAKEMSEVLDENSAIFSMLYEDIVQESPYLRGLCGIGSNEHLRLVWQHSLKELVR